MSEGTIRPGKPPRDVIDPDHHSFEPDFYLRAYTDIDPDRVNPERHFREYGFEEGRFGSRDELTQAVAIVRASGRFDAGWYREAYGVASRPIEDYLIKETDARRAPNRSFDRKFFVDHYPGEILPRERPFVTYCRLVSRATWCRDSAQAFEADVATIGASGLFDEAFFRGKCGDLDGDTDPLLYYLTEGARRGLDPSPQFSTRGYLMLYPDIAAAELNPLVHYVRYGEKEGRHRLGIDQQRRRSGSASLRRERATVLIVSHESSLSGAPVVGLNLARCLGGTYNVLCALLRDGALTEAFAKVSHEVVITGDSPAHMVNSIDALTNEYEISCVVLNSVECTKMLPMLIERGIPAVSLIHEFAQYVWPFDQFARSLALSDVAIFPSKLVEAHAKRELRARGVPDRPLVNVRIRPQGRPLVPVVRTANGLDMAQVTRRLDREITRQAQPDRPFVVLGAGWVQPRKGVDLFIEVARLLVKEMKVHALFVWVGPNYHPITDTILSVYLADQVTKSGLDEDIVFFDEQPDLRPFYERADAFLLSSRLDPFPNVAVEAIAEGKHLVCFEGSTGIADLAIWPEAVTAVPYNDLRGAAEVLAKLAGARTDDPTAKRPLPPDLQHLLSFEDYARDIATAIEDARKRMRSRRESVRDLLADGGFDPRLFVRSLPAWATYENGGKRSDETLAGFAAVLAANEMPIALVRADRSTGGGADWSRANIVAVEPEVADDALAYRRHIVFIEDADEVEAIADFAFGAPVQALMIISDSLTRDDLLAVERVLGEMTLSVLSPAAPDFTLIVASFLDAAGSDSIVGITFRMSAHAEAASNGARALHEACKASAKADVFLLSALVLKPDPEFLKERKMPAADGENSAGGALAHHLVDCRRCWLRNSSINELSVTFITTLARQCDRLKSADVWRALVVPGGLLSKSFAYVNVIDYQCDMKILSVLSK